MLVLGLLATMPIGMIIGALVPERPEGGLLGDAAGAPWRNLGDLLPDPELWGWLQVVAQIFPMYWLGLGMRSAFLPDSAAALEVGGMAADADGAVLAAWAVP